MMKSMEAEPGRKDKGQREGTGVKKKQIGEKAN